MTTARFTIERNVLFLTAANGTSAAGMFALNLAAARRLGPDVFGEYSLALNFAAAFVFLSHLGLDVVVTRDAARHPGEAHGLIGHALLIGTALSITAALLVVVASVLFDVGSPLLVALLGMAFIANTPAFFCRALFRARQRMAFELIVSLLYTSTLLALSLGALFATSSPVAVVAAFPLASITASLAAIRLLSRTGVQATTFSVQPALARSLLVMTIPFTLNGLLLPLFARVDVLMLGRLEGAAAVGIYVAALNLVAPLSIVGPSLGQALFPVLAVSYWQEPLRYRAVLVRAFALATVAVVGAGLTVTLFGDVLLREVFGSDYAAASAPMSLLIFAAGGSFLNAILFSALEATGRQTEVTRLLAIGLVIGLVATAILIPPLGLSGAALAALLAQSSVLLMASARRCLPVLLGRRAESVAVRFES